MELNDAAVQKMLRHIAASANATAVDFFTFEVKRPGERSAITGAKGFASTSWVASTSWGPHPSGPAAKIHLTIARLPDATNGGTTKRIPHLLAVVAQEQEGKLVFRQLFSR